MSDSNLEQVLPLKPKPATPDAKYITYCKNCNRTLLRFPNAHGMPLGELAHPIITVTERGFDVSGWYINCNMTHPSEDELKLIQRGLALLVQEVAQTGSKAELERAVYLFKRMTPYIEN